MQDELEPLSDQQPQAANDGGGLAPLDGGSLAAYMKAQVIFSFPLALGLSLLFMGGEFAWLFLALFGLMLALSALGAPFRQKLDIRTRWHSSPLLLGLGVTAIICAALYAAAMGEMEGAQKSPRAKGLDTLGLTNASTFDMMAAGAEPHLLAGADVFAPRRFALPQSGLGMDKEALEGSLLLIDEDTLCKFIAAVEPVGLVHPAISYVLGVWDGYGLHRTALDAGFGIVPALTRKRILEGFTGVDSVRRVESPRARGYAVHGKRLDRETEYIFAVSLTSGRQMQAWAIGCGLSDKEAALIILGMGARE